mmetsp:Transcript_53337/g.121573  ORF Transcript_53337/g.121573 Transcript_53337/m.121573 type:complete len:289 (+) Transcript_53337:455-1321(+)
MDVENVGWLGRFLAAQVSKFGIPIPTSVSPEVLGRAKQLSKKGPSSASSDLHEQAAADNKGDPKGGDKRLYARPLRPGVLSEGHRLPLAAAEFFTLQVNERMADHGVVLAARSKRKNDRFRIIVFDSHGDVRHMCESSALPGESGKAVARCRLFLTPHSTLSVGAPFPSLDDTPPVCHSLDTLEERGPSALEPGSHLIAVYCDNFLSTIDFTIAAVPMEPSDRNENSAKRVAAMSSVADELKEKKVELNSLAETIVARRDALVRAQEEFKAAMAQAAAEEPKVNPWRS